MRNAEIFKVEMAQTEEERNRAYRLRYEVYVEEMEKMRIQANHKEKAVCDELDDESTVFYVEHAGQLVGTARLRVGSLKEFPEDIVSALQLQSFRAVLPDGGRISFLSHCLVRGDFRRTDVFSLLFTRCYAYACEKQAALICSKCELSLIRLYEQMGFERYGENILVPGQGIQLPMALVVGNEQHFKRVGSPLSKIEKKMGAAEEKALECLQAKQREGAATVNRQLVSQEDWWEAMTEALQASPLQEIPLLNGLTASEAKAFLRACGSIVSFRTGDVFFAQGEPSVSCNILLAGSFRSLTILSPELVYDRPGQTLGENGLVGRRYQRESVAAATDAKVLVLADIAFAQFSETHFDTAHQLVKNLLALP